MTSRKTLKHELALLKVQLRALEVGAIVNRPVVEGTRYDLVIDYEGCLYRAQVKYADSSRDDAFTVSFQSSANGKVTQKFYKKSEVDVILVYAPKVDKLLWLNIEDVEGRSTMAFKLRPSKNNQSKGCHVVDDYIW